MEALSEIFAWIMANGLMALGAIIAILGGILMILKAIPGNQGEDAIEGILNVLKKILDFFSKKKK